MNVYYALNEISNVNMKTQGGILTRREGQDYEKREKEGEEEKKQEDEDEERSEQG